MVCHSGYFSGKKIILHGSLMSDNTIMIFKPNAKDKFKYEESFKLTSPKIGNVKFDIFNKSEIYLKPLDEVLVTSVKPSRKERISYVLHNPNTKDLIIGKLDTFEVFKII